MPTPPLTAGFAAQLAQDLGPDDVRMILSVFRADLTRLDGELHEAAAAQDATAFRRAAHGLAGAAGAVGAAELEAACRAAMARTGADMMGPDLAAIHGLAEASLDDLATYVARLDGGPHG